jgi:Leucine-rich repeat (LRR) protein
MDRFVCPQNDDVDRRAGRLPADSGAVMLGYVLGPRSPSDVPENRVMHRIVATLLLLGVLLGVSLSCRPRSGPASANAPTASGTTSRAESSPGPIDDWVAAVRKLPPKKQIEAVAQKMKQHNPGFDGWLQPTLDFAGITRLELFTDQVQDLRPLQGLNPLLSLRCAGRDPGKGKVADLRPLEGLPLTALEVDNNPITDLSPLRNMKLTALSAAHTNVSDLTPLRDMPLEKLNVFHTSVRDLAPLREMALVEIDCRETQVTDLAPLKSMALRKLWCDFNLARDGAVVKSLWNLESINGDPVIAFWQKHDPTHGAYLQWISDTKKIPVEKQADSVERMMRLRNPGFTGPMHPRIENGIVVDFAVTDPTIVDLSPLRALPRLQLVECGGCTNFTDLATLGGLPLKYLLADGTRLSDLTPIRRMKLQRLSISGTRVADLAPLREMPLWQLHAANIPATDLTPVKNLPLRELSWSFQKDRDLALLRSMKMLETINQKPAAEFWKEVGAP